VDAIDWAGVQAWIAVLGAFALVGLYVAARFVWAAFKTFLRWTTTLLKFALIIGAAGFVVGIIAYNALLIGG
jgi:hypothetical protein